MHKKECGTEWGKRLKLGIPRIGALLRPYNFLEVSISADRKISFMYIINSNCDYS